MSGTLGRGAISAADEGARGRPATPTWRGARRAAIALLQERTRIPAEISPHTERLATISKQMRRDRELAFYGTEDLTPSDFYNAEDARIALADATFVVQTVGPYVESLA